MKCNPLTPSYQGTPPSRHSCETHCARFQSALMYAHGSTTCTQPLTTMKRTPLAPCTPPRLQAFPARSNSSSDSAQASALAGVNLSEIGSVLAYHSVFGACLASGAIGPLLGMQFLSQNEEEEGSDNRRMVARSRDITHAAQATRLRCLVSRRPRHGTTHDAEMCVVCQVDFAGSEWALACRTCDSGFHARCLNTWLLRSEVCPCCRTRVSSLSALVPPQPIPVLQTTSRPERPAD